MIQHHALGALSDIYDDVKCNGVDHSISSHQWIPSHNRQAQCRPEVTGEAFSTAQAF